MRNWTIGRRITFGFAVVLTIMLALGIFTRTKVGIIQKGTAAVAQSSIPGLEYLTDAKEAANDIRVQTFKHISSESSGDMDQLEAKIEKAKDDVKAAADFYAHVVGWTAKNTAGTGERPYIVLSAGAYGVAVSTNLLAVAAMADSAVPYRYRQQRPDLPREPGTRPGQLYQSLRRAGCCFHDQQPAGGRRRRRPAARRSASPSRRAASARAAGRRVPARRPRAARGPVQFKFAPLFLVPRQALNHSRMRRNSPISARR